MTYNDFVVQIGKEVTGFLTKFQYDGKSSKDSFWVKVNQGIISWSNKYAATQYSFEANRIIESVFNIIEFETGMKEDV